MNSVINESDFKVERGLYAVKFWATWCGPCRLMDPMIKKLESEFENVTFLSVDIEQVYELAKKYQIKSVPTLLLIRDGEIIENIVGVHQLQSLKNSFNNLVGSKENIEKDKLDVAL